MLRRTFMRRSGGGHAVVRPPIDQLEPADACRGWLKPEYYNGNLKIMRVLDLKWWVNRMTALYREGVMAAMVFYPYLYGFFWVSVQTATFRDAAPPRHVDWNKKSAGCLPAGFEKTPVKTA